MLNSTGLKALKLDRLQELILQETVNRLRMLTKHAPQDVSRNFLEWILTNDNIYRNEYLQVTGVLKLAELGAFLIHDLLDTTTSKKMCDYLGTLNAFFFFEIVSDNLASGLACPQTNSKNLKLQKEVLFHFNNLIQQKISGEKISSKKMLLPMTDKIKSLSIFDKSLASKQLQKFAELYCKTNSSAVNQNIEYSLLTYLILNIESNLLVMEEIEDQEILRLVRRSLCDRYTAGNELLQLRPNTSIETLIDYGTQTILITPVMLYIASSINTIKPNLNWEDVLREGFLYKAIVNAACLIRIVNDIGTHLLNPNHNELKKLKQELFNNQVQPSFLDSLIAISEIKRFSYSLSRIRKDIRHCEFNICLDNIRLIKDQKKACNLFLDNIITCCNIYKEKRMSLLHILDQLSHSLKEDIISSIILRMLIFHETMYEQHFENSSGDFATSF